MIKVYSTPTCPWCQRVKEFLKENRVEFENVDVSADQDAAMEMIEKSNQMSVPVIDFNGVVIIGFNEEALTRAIKM